MQDHYLAAIFSNTPEKLMRFLDDRPSLLELQWADCYRPLHWAALYGCDRSIELLLQRGANVNARIEVPSECGSGDSNVWYDHQMRLAQQGWSARDLAIHANFPDIAQRLEVAGAPKCVAGPGLDREWWHRVVAGYRQRS